MHVYRRLKCLRQYDSERCERYAAGAACSQEGRSQGRKVLESVRQAVQSSTSEAREIVQAAGEQETGFGNHTRPVLCPGLCKDLPSLVFNARNFRELKGAFWRRVFCNQHVLISSICTASEEGSSREVFTESSRPLHPTGATLQAEIDTHHDYFHDLEAVAR